MSNDEIKQSVSALYPSVSYEETGEFLNILISPGVLPRLMKTLYADNKFRFDYLFCLTCIDWKTNLTMVYHLLSKVHRHSVVVKAQLSDINNPEIETVCKLWKTADFHEREVYDLFGVRFLKHPDLRRILLDEHWEGYPLRKNYVDENMIKL